MLNEPLSTFLPWAFMVTHSMALPIITVFALSGAVLLLYRILAFPQRILWLALVMVLPLTAAAFFLAGRRVTAALPPHPPALRIAHLNSLIFQPDIAPKIAFVQQADADIVSLVEARPALTNGLMQSNLYPYSARSSLGNPSFPLPMLLLSRWPITLEKAWSPRLRLYHIAHPTRPFYVLQIHADSPHTSTALAERNAQLAALNPASLPQPLVTVGDFNTTPWDPAFRPFRKTFPLPLSTYLPTFPSALPLTPIDHLLATPNLPQPTVRRIRVAATDHLGLLADFPRF